MRQLIALGLMVGLVQATGTSLARDAIIRVDWVGPFFSDRYVPVTRDRVTEHASCRTTLDAKGDRARILQDLPWLRETVIGQGKERFNTDYVRVRIIGLREFAIFIDMHGVVATSKDDYGQKIGIADLATLRNALFPGCDPNFDNVR